jgi:hypothetical protein
MASTLDTDVDMDASGGPWQSPMAWNSRKRDREDNEELVRKFSPWDLKCCCLKLMCLFLFFSDWKETESLVKEGEKEEKVTYILPCFVEVVLKFGVEGGGRIELVHI